MYKSRFLGFSMTDSEKAKRTKYDVTFYNLSANALENIIKVQEVNPIIKQRTKSHFMQIF